MALSGRAANVKITAATPTTAAGEAVVAASSVVFQIADPDKRHWERYSTASRPVVYDGASPTTASYTVNYVQGIVSFTTVPGPVGTVTLDVEYLTASAVASAREWTLNVDRDMIEISNFGSSGWREYQQLFVGANATLARYWIDSAFMDHIVADQPDLLVELLPSSTAGDRYEAFARITGNAVSTPTDGVVGESLQVTIVGPLYYTTST